MSDETEHSPAPWHVHDDSWPPAIRDSNDEGVALIRSDFRSTDGDAINAAHIVRCVNAHDAMAEALATVVNSGPLNNGMRDDAAMSLARAALALARP